MECSEVRELLSPMTDHEVAAEDLRIVEEHLRDCRECAFQSSMIVGLKRLLGRWDGVHASERFRVAVLDRVRKEPPPKRVALLPWVLGGGLAVVCVVVLVLAVAVPVAPEGPDDSGDAYTSAARTGPRVGGARAVRPRDDARDNARDGARDDARDNASDAGPADARPVPGGNATTGPLAAPVAQFRTIAAAVYMERPGAFPALATVGDVVTPGAAVRCSEKGAARLALVAGLFMRLEGGAHVAFADDDFDCELRAGRVLFGVKDRAKPRRPYSVRSGTVTVTLKDVDRALVAAVERLPVGTLRLVVAEGEAAVVCAGGERTVGRGQAVEFDAEGRPSEATADAEEFLKLRRWGRP